MTVADHQNTSSWGPAGAAYRAEQLQLVQQGKYLTALVKDIYDIQNRFGTKYDPALKQMYIYATETLHWTE